jgi:hypothetical protein
MTKNIFLLTLFTFNIVSAKVDTISVETAAGNKSIKLDIEGIGGYQGKCIKMKMKYLMTDSVWIHVEAGRRLDSKDSSQQDILVVKDEFILLVKKKEITIDVTGFCCQAHKGSPTAKSIFFVGAIAEKSLYEIAVYISKHPKLNTGSIQNAVWAISDHNEISSVVDDGTAEVADLRKFLAKLKNMEVPWYNISYYKVRGQLFSGKPEKVTGPIPYNVSDVSQIIVSIRNTQGTIVYQKSMGTVNRGQYVHDLNWVIRENTPLGVYTVGLYENGREIKKLAITLK